MRSEKKNPRDDSNPGFVTKELCEAYRESIRAEIRGLRNTIIVGFSISTTVISIIVALMQYFV